MNSAAAIASTDVVLPDGYRRPESCRDDGPTPSHELTVSLVMAGSGGLTTDDSKEVARIVDEIDMKPHLFAERYLKLERDLAQLLERVNGLCAREVI